MPQSFTKSLLVVALSLCHMVTASTVAVYKDTDCKSTITTLTASNGYPDGICTEVAGKTTEGFQSFKFLSLDPGCAATVYQADDDDVCSGYAIVASLSTCYNNSWVDFSVDECIKPIASSNTTGNATVSSHPPTASSTTASTTSSSSSGSASSSTESAKSGVPLDNIARAGRLGLWSAAVLGLYFLV